MNFAVLNPGGRDPDQIFPNGAGPPDDSLHPPVNYHGFAAALQGGFYRKDQAIPKEARRVLVLLRRDLKACRQALLELRRAGKKVVVAFKEAGSFQVASLLSTPDRLGLFTEICARAHAAVATTSDLVGVFRGGGVREVEFIPTPYPLDDPWWDFSVPRDERRGIFLGTREFDTPSRNHLAALLCLRQLAEPMQEPVTVFNVDGWKGRRMLDRCQFPEGLLRVIPGPLPYPRYLRVLAKHKIVFQLDASAVPGQVAGDALLCRTPCVGGNGTVERLAFPDLCGHGRTSEQLFDLAARLLEHPHDVEASVEASLEAGRVALSYQSVARRVEGLFARLGE